MLGWVIILNSHWLCQTLVILTALPFLGECRMYSGDWSDHTVCNFSLWVRLWVDNSIKSACRPDHFYLWIVGFLYLVIILVPCIKLTHQLGHLRAFIRLFCYYRLVCNHCQQLGEELLRVWWTLHFFLRTFFFGLTSNRKVIFICFHIDLLFLVNHLHQNSETLAWVFPEESDEFRFGHHIQERIILGACHSALVIAVCNHVIIPEHLPSVDHSQPQCLCSLWCPCLTRRLPRLFQ